MQEDPSEWIAFHNNHPIIKPTLTSLFSELLYAVTKQDADSAIIMNPFITTLGQYAPEFMRTIPSYLSCQLSLVHPIDRQNGHPLPGASNYILSNAARYLLQVSNKTISETGQIIPNNPLLHTVDDVNEIKMHLHMFLKV